MPNTMKAAQISKPGSDFVVAEKAVPEPGPSTVRMKVAASGVCHSDPLVKEGHWPKLTYPRVPGHEVAGVIEAVGPGISEWAVGERVGIGWHGGHCSHCEPCRSGDFIACSNLSITGFHFDGGYEQYMIAPANGLARIPDTLGFSDAAPLLCAGVTTFNSLRHSRALPGDLVAVTASAVWATLASSLRVNSGSMLSPFRVGRTNRSWRCDWVRTFTSTLAQRIQQRS